MRQLMLRLAGVLLLLVLFAGGALATLPAALEGGWGSIDGGGASSGGSFTLSGTAGQADAGALGGGRFQLEGGFWHAELSTRRSYLPLLMR